MNKSAFGAGTAKKISSYGPEPDCFALAIIPYK
jgi:hypothetical protein